MTLALAIHGGCGTLPKAEMTEAEWAQARSDLASALRVGWTILSKGGPAVDAALNGTDALVMPTAAGVAWRWADLDSGTMGVHNRGTRFLPLADLTGHPAVSIPVPTTGLPVGIQLIGRHNGDAQLLDTAAWLEAALKG